MFYITASEYFKENLSLSWMLTCVDHSLWCAVRSVILDNLYLGSHWCTIKACESIGWNYVMSDFIVPPFCVKFVDTRLFDIQMQKIHFVDGIQIASIIILVTSLPQCKSKAIRPMYGA